MTVVDTAWRPGDIVFVGPPAPLDQKVTWQIVALHQAAEGLVYASLRSGLTGMSRTCPTARLTRYTPERNA